jgi:thioredoxin-like negative regulator of GroEL
LFKNNVRLNKQEKSLVFNVDEVAQQYSNQVKVVKVNTDKNPSVASQYGVRSISNQS